MSAYMLTARLNALGGTSAIRPKFWGNEQLLQEYARRRAALSWPEQSLVVQEVLENARHNLKLIEKEILRRMNAKAR